jgi:hypothetical protein
MAESAEVPALPVVPLVLKFPIVPEREVFPFPAKHPTSMSPLFNEPEMRVEGPEVEILVVKTLPKPWLPVYWVMLMTVSEFVGLNLRVTELAFAVACT